MESRYDTSLLRSCGEDVRISGSASIRPELVTVGDHVAIDEFFVASTQLELASFIHISKHVGVIGGTSALLRMGWFTNISLGGKIICCSDSFKGAGLITAPGIPNEFRDSLINEPVVFRDFANIGASVTILPGVVLPQGVVIGAGSLVRKSDQLEPWTIYAGNPLKKISNRPKEKMIDYAQQLGYKPGN